MLTSSPSLGGGFLPLSQYATGRIKPSERTAKRITANLHEFGKNLSQIELVRLEN